MKKKGFTLIELMIVLAVIAILAVVLVPKVGQTKNSAKEAGVTTNVNVVRAALEPKTGAKFMSNASDVYTYLSTAYATSDVDNRIANPFSNSYVVTSGTEAQPAVFVTASASEPTAATLISTYKGSVIVEVDGTGYTYKIYGVDNNGKVIGDPVTIKK